MQLKRGRWAALIAVGIAGLVVVPNAQAATSTLTNGCVTSVPEPDTTASVQICYSLYRPASADADHPVPMVFSSHGWGGSRTNAAGSFAKWTDAGFGVLSFDQRGFGESGGKAHVENPDFEGQDVQRLVDMVGALDWVAKDGPDDPVLGAIGGSYGGGYQFVGAFTELRDRGVTRFDALAPEITWWDLKESLAPAGVVRSAWVSLLYATGVQAHTTEVHEGFAYGAATGDWPSGQIPGIDLDAFFAKNGPKWHVSQGRKLDIPVLFGQGETDNLFNLNQGLKNFDNALTDEARGESIFIGYNAGHTLPEVVPPGVTASGDPCSKAIGGGSFEDLTIQFFRKHLRHEDVALPATDRYYLATQGGACLTVDSDAANTAYSLGRVVSTTGAGAPVTTKIASGPITIAGTPFVDTKVTSLALDGRAFFGLAVGTSVADAKVVQNNLMPLHETAPVQGVARTIELPAVSVEVPAGQSLFLIVTPISDMSFGHGSRTPGALILDKTVVRLPVVHQ